MQTEFTPLLSLIGGMLIGLAALVLMATNGQIAGISGIVSQVLPPSINRSKAITSAAFIVGLLLAAPAVKIMTGTLPEATMVAHPVLLVIAGLVVGLGTGTGNGCTSGHGVCGLSRFSTRSLIATVTFMLTAAITVYIVRHIVGAVQ